MTPRMIARKPANIAAVRFAPVKANVAAVPLLLPPAVPLLLPPAVPLLLPPAVPLLLPPAVPLLPEPAAAVVAIGAVVVVVFGAVVVVVFGAVVVVVFGAVVVVVVGAVVVVVVVVVVAVVAAHVELVMVFVSRVTSALRASSRPNTVAPVWASILVSAKTVPTNTEFVPSVAELRTSQKTLHAWAPFMTATWLSDAVMSVLAL
jgi:hypothetical protein